MGKTSKSTPIGDYIAAFPPAVRVALRAIQSTVRKAAPQAEEILSYRMPAFRQGKILIYFAAFKKHIGIYPPARGDAGLEKAVSRYAGPKGNLKLPLDEPMPLGLIRRIVQHRLRAISAGQKKPR